MDKLYGVAGGALIGASHYVGKVVSEYTSGLEGGAEYQTFMYGLTVATCVMASIPLLHDSLKERDIMFVLLGLPGNTRQNYNESEGDVKHYPEYETEVIEDGSF